MITKAIPMMPSVGVAYTKADLRILANSNENTFLILCFIIRNFIYGIGSFILTIRYGCFLFNYSDLKMNQNASIYLSSFLSVGILDC